MHWFITLCVRANQRSPSWFLLESSSAMPWQIGTAPVYLPCPLASYSCTITLCTWAALATCLALCPCNTKGKLLCFQGTWHRRILKSLLDPSSNLCLSLYQEEKEDKTRSLGFALGCACNIHVVHLRIAEKNLYVQKDKDLCTLRSLMYEDVCAGSFYRDFVLLWSYHWPWNFTFTGASCRRLIYVAING